MLDGARFAGKLALVTGAGGAIGREISLALSREGATVFAADLAGDRAEATARVVLASGGRAHGVPLDVTSETQVSELISAIASRHGRLDVAVNNAGIVGRNAPTAELDRETWEEVLRVDLVGVFLCLKHELLQMQAQGGGGTIVNIASTVGVRMTVPGTAAYAAAKAGVSALTRTAAQEYVRAGIRVNAVCPGPVNTPMSRLPGESDSERDLRMRDALPIGRVATVAEIAAAVLWLAAPESGYAVGHDLVVDGGGSI